MTEKVVRARYRFREESMWLAKTDQEFERRDLILKVYRPMRICQFCIKKGRATGYFGNGRIYVDAIWDGEEG